MNRTFEDDVNPQEIVVIALYVYICLYINLHLLLFISAPFIIFILSLDLDDWRPSFSFLSSTGLFLLFTSMLVVTQINLILKGQTTVESVQIMGLKDRENRTLAKGFDCWEIMSVNSFFGGDNTYWLSNVVSSAKRRKQKEWDQEWGRLNAEGHIWWRGNLREQWIDVMGDWWLGWIRE